MSRRTCRDVAAFLALLCAVTLLALPWITPLAVVGKIGLNVAVVAFVAVGFLVAGIE